MIYSFDDLKIKFSSYAKIHDKISNEVLANNAAVNLPHLRARLEDTGILTENDTFELNELQTTLKDRFATIDFELAKQDVLPFVADKSKLELWSKEFFIYITQNLKCKE